MCMGVHTEFYWMRVLFRDKTTSTDTGFTKCLDIAISWLNCLALSNGFAPCEPLCRTAATPSYTVRYSNIRRQRASKVKQLVTPTTRPQCSVLGLVIICSDNNVSVRAVTLCGLEPPLNHTVKGSDAVSAKHWRTSLFLSLCLCLPFLCCLSTVYRFGVTSFVSVCASVSVRCTYNPL